MPAANCEKSSVSAASLALLIVTPPCAPWLKT